MPIYEYFCNTCSSRFEMLRPMSRVHEDATCPQGHSGGRLKLSTPAPIKQSVDVDFDYMADYDDNQEAAPLPGQDGFAEADLGGGCSCGAGGCGNC